MSHVYIPPRRLINVWVCVSVCLSTCQSLVLSGRTKSLQSAEFANYFHFTTKLPKTDLPIRGVCSAGVLGGGGVGVTQGDSHYSQRGRQGLCDLVGTVFGYPFRFEVPVASVWNPCIIKYLRTNLICLNKISRHSVGQLTPMLISCVVLHIEGILQTIASPCFFVCTNYVLNIYCYKEIGSPLFIWFG